MVLDDFVHLSYKLAVCLGCADGIVVVDSGYRLRLLFLVVEIVGQRMVVLDIEELLFPLHESQPEERIKRRQEQSEEDTEDDEPCLL